MKLASFLSSAKGFSLPELMMGGAILAGVGLAGAMLFKNQSKAQRSLEHDQDLTQFHENLVRVFTNSQACNATLRNYKGAPHIPLGPLNSSDVTSGLANCTSADYVAPAGKCSNYKVETGAAFTELIPPDATMKRWINGKRIWRISSIGLPFQVTSSGDLRMHIFYQNEALNPPKTVKKDLVVGVRFKNGAGSGFVECVNPHTATINNAQSDLCKALNNNRTKTGDGNFVATWDEELQKCNIVDYNTSALTTNDECPSGQIFEGYHSDGSISCKPIPSQINTLNSVDSPRSNCASTKIEVINGQVKIICY